MYLAHRLRRIDFLVTLRTGEILKTGDRKFFTLESAGPLSFDFSDRGTTARWTAGNGERLFFSACFHSALLAEMRKGAGLRLSDLDFLSSNETNRVTFKSQQLTKS